MLRARDVLELSRRFRGTLTKAESDVIYTNILVIFGVEFFLGISQVRSVIIRCLGPTLVSWLYTAVRVVLFIFGMNVILTAQRVASRLLVQIQAPSSAAPRAQFPRPSGPKYLIKDEVTSRPLDLQAPLPIAKSSSMMNFHASDMIRSMSMAPAVPVQGTLQSFQQKQPLNRVLPASLAMPGGLPLPTAAVSTPFRVLASPAPASMPGTPAAADDLSKRLPAWTDKLMGVISAAGPVDKESGKDTGQQQSPEVPVRDANEVPTKVSKVVERRSLTPDESVAELSLGLDMERATEGLRAWFSKRILQPLARDIDETVSALAKSGLDHLNPFHPASFSASLFGGATQPPALKSLIAINPGGAQQPQSLMDLAQRSQEDPMVQKRLRLEKYLAFANLASRRAFVIGRIQAMAKGNLLAAFNPAQGLDSDTEILLSLFCTFLDEHLPSSDYYDAQPFSGKHFIRIGEKPSMRPDAIQIAQIGPQSFELIADGFIFRSYPGPSNLLHSIIFLVEYVQRHREGFLGIANLSSPSIGLSAIFA